MTDVFHSGEMTSSSMENCIYNISFFLMLPVISAHVQKYVCCCRCGLVVLESSVIYCVFEFLAKMLTMVQHICCCSTRKPFPLGTNTEVSPMWYSATVVELLSEERG